MLQGMKHNANLDSVVLTVLAFVYGGRNVMLNDDGSCLVEKCCRASSRRGLCLVCYSKAKRAVETGTTTWEELERLGLAGPSGDVDPFDEALKKARASNASS